MPLLWVMRPGACPTINSLALGETWKMGRGPRGRSLQILQERTLSSKEFSIDLLAMMRPFVERAAVCAALWSCLCGLGCRGTVFRLMQSDRSKQRLFSHIEVSRPAWFWQVESCKYQQQAQPKFESPLGNKSIVPIEYPNISEIVPAMKQTWPSARPFLDWLFYAIDEVRILGGG